MIKKQKGLYLFIYFVFIYLNVFKPVTIWSHNLDAAISESDKMRISAGVCVCVGTMGHLEVAQGAEPRRDLFQTVVVQVDLADVGDVGQTAVLHKADLVEAQAQSATRQHNMTIYFARRTHFARVRGFFFLHVAFSRALFRHIFKSVDKEMQMSFYDDRSYFVNRRQ